MEAAPKALAAYMSTLTMTGIASSAVPPPTAVAQKVHSSVIATATEITNAFGVVPKPREAASKVLRVGMNDNTATVN